MGKAAHPAVLSCAVLLGGLGGCSNDFKVVVKGLPSDLAVNALVVAVDANGRHADAAVPLDLQGYSAAQREGFRDSFSFPLDITGLSPVSGHSRISVAAARLDGSGRPCIDRSGSTEATANSDDPAFAEVQVSLLDPVTGTSQVPAPGAICGQHAPVILGVRREASGPLNSAVLRLSINGWGFAQGDKITITRCEPMLTASGPSCDVEQSGTALTPGAYEAKVFSEASIEVELLPAFAQEPEMAKNLIGYTFPLKITVESVTPSGAPSGAKAEYVEPKPNIAPRTQ